MNAEKTSQMEEIIKDLHDFTRHEHPHTQQVTIKRCKCLQLEPDVFINIKCCNDFIAKGIKFETYSTSRELPDFRGGGGGRGFPRANSGKCTMHSDDRKHDGLIFRCNMYESEDQTPLVLECREFILYILRTFCPSYVEGPYRRSAERVQIMNLTC